MANSEERKIGFYGYPSKDVIEALKNKNPDSDWLDLDIDLNAADSGISPNGYCRIIRNIIDNSVHFRNDIKLIVASVGYEKCDGGRYAAFLLRELGFEVIETTNDLVKSCDNPQDILVPISTSNLPLADKIERIMNTVIAPDTASYIKVEPSHGFWGVPPHDFEFLKLFPNTTHVYGWTRTVEAGRPADIDLECFIDEDVPTVFFAQSFCQKSQLAKYLAEKFGGLFIDADGKIGMGVKSRIEAFLELNRRDGQAK